MFAPIFEIAKSDFALTALLGSNPLRLYPFGNAPQDVLYPYAVWQTISGSPENYLGNRPDADNVVLQVDVYGKTAESVRAVSLALNNALETKGYITRFGHENRDPDTKNYHYDFDVEFITSR